MDLDEMGLATRRAVLGDTYVDGALAKATPYIPHIEFVNRTEFPPNGGRLFQVLPA